MWHPSSTPFPWHPRGHHYGQRAQSSVPPLFSQLQCHHLTARPPSFLDKLQLPLPESSARTPGPSEFMTLAALACPIFVPVRNDILGTLGFLSSHRPLTRASPHLGSVFLRAGSWVSSTQALLTKVLLGWRVCLSSVLLKMFSEYTFCCCLGSEQPRCPFRTLRVALLLQFLQCCCTVDLLLSHIFFH